jgi:hypothetical protein
VLWDVKCEWRERRVIYLFTDLGLRKVGAVGATLGWAVGLGGHTGAWVR